jgi:hypothetical protein
MPVNTSTANVNKASFADGIWHLSQEEWHQIGRAVHADADDKREE